MTPIDPRKYIFVATVFIKGNAVLTLFRNGTERNSLKHGLIGGKLQNGETPRAGAVRKTLEEIGLAVKPQDLSLVHVMSCKQYGWETLCYYFLVKTWNGEPTNKQPQIHERLEWLNLSHLPETMIDRNVQALENIRHKISYSEYGW